MLIPTQGIENHLSSQKAIVAVLLFAQEERNTKVGSPDTGPTLKKEQELCFESTWRIFSFFKEKYDTFIHPN